MLTPELKTQTEFTTEALKQAKKLLSLKKGDCIIITAGTSTSDPGTTNTIRIEKI